MKRIMSLMMSVVAFVTSQDIQKEIVALKNPVNEVVTTGLSSQCTTLKKLIGVTYEQLEKGKEPDVNLLSLVYRTRGSSKAYNISDAVQSLRQARAFDSKEKLVVFVHGFTDDPYSASFGNFSEYFFDADEDTRVTLLALDGSPLLYFWYLRSSTYITFMGQKLAEVLATLVKGGLDPSQIHMVGHSLGAHVSSFTGKQFKSLTGRKLGRISGLDPAGPCFTHIDEGQRLQKTDAEYVDVIHTDAGVLGIRTPVGHADYYPNSGAQQPDCFFETCSHSRVWLLYAESILHPRAFPARRCGSWQDFTENKCSDEISYMGYHSKPGTVGQFYLQTAGHSPFGLGPKGANYTNNVGIVRNVQGALGKVPIINKLPFTG